MIEFLAALQRVKSNAVKRTVPPSTTSTSSALKRPYYDDHTSTCSLKKNNNRRIRSLTYQPSINVYHEEDIENKPPQQQEQQTAPLEIQGCYNFPEVTLSAGMKWFGKPFLNEEPTIPIPNTTTTTTTTDKTKLLKIYQDLFCPLCRLGIYTVTASGNKRVPNQARYKNNSALNTHIRQKHLDEDKKLMKDVVLDHQTGGSFIQFTR